MRTKLSAGKKPRLANAFISIGVVLALTPVAFTAYFKYEQNALTAAWQTAKRRSASPAANQATKGKRRLTLADLTAAPALLVIPKIGLQAAVVDGTSPLDLAKGPGLVDGTPRPGQEGNVVVSGHRTMYGAPFGRLNELRAGDDLVLKLPNADVVYKVTEAKQVWPKDISVTEDFGDDRLTLTTCDPPFSARYRLVVVGKFARVDSVK